MSKDELGNLLSIGKYFMEQPGLGDFFVKIFFRILQSQTLLEGTWSEIALSLYM